MKRIKTRTTLRLWLSYLCTLGVQRSRSFTCCAGCDLLSVPVANRLCVSIFPGLEVDAILLGCLNAEDIPTAVASIRASMPWLRRIHIPVVGMEAPDKGVFSIPKGIGEAELHHMDALSEQFIALPQGCLPKAPLLPVDFFTPNGLPLLFAGPGGSAEAPNFLSDAASRTKSLSALFAEACAVDPALADHCGLEGYALVFARWVYAQCHGIIAPSPFPA